MNKIIIGVTGGTGTGKSTAAQFFFEKGFYIIDADKMGHTILRQKAIKNKLIANFGKEIVQNGEIERLKLGKIVFKNKSDLKKLNEIVHPLLIDQIRRKISSLNDHPILIDAALLLDWNLDKICDFVIIINTDFKIRLQRLIRKNNLTIKEAKERIKSQSFNLSKCTFSISNNSTKLSFIHKLDSIWEEIQR